MHKLRAAVLSTLCLAVSACATDRQLYGLRPDLDHPDRFICEPTGTRPPIPAEYVIDWSKVATVEQAKAEHEKFVGVLRTREGLVAGYVLDLEGKHFTCFSNMAWQRDYYSKLPKPAQAGGTAAPAH